MTLLVGARLGPYEITGLLGAGGMGEVYRADDTKLKREVALKVLRAGFTSDSDRLARFQREGEVLASLNHPNIGSIYGVEEAEGVRALVMELVDGPTLADRLVQGPMPEDEAVAITTQIAEALEVAHEHGIIHRDLKPANVKVRADGTVKVLDFGLAKVLSGGLGDAVGPARTTMSTPAATRSGMILGTAAYLSPEQAKGKPVDARTDIWGLGCILYEMLTGRAAFAQETISETLARVLDHDPAWDALPSETSSNIQHLLHRCLEKDPKRRLHSAADVRIAIEDAVTVKDADGSAIHTRRRHKAAIVAWLVAAAAILIAVAVSWTTARRAAPDIAPLRLDVTTPPTNDFTSFALSPDGRSIVFVALGEQTPQLFLRQLDQTELQRLPETEGASYPFWSPSSRSIGFFSGGLLKRIDLAGGRPQVLAQARNPMGGAWNRDDVIIYAPSASSPLMRVPATGGTPALATRLASGELSHRFPTFLPDAQRFLFFVTTSAPKDEGVYLGSTNTTDTSRRLIAGESGAEYSATGWLLIIREGALIALPLDVTKGSVSGDPITLAPHVVPVQGRGAFSASASGLVAYRTGGMSSPVKELVWVDRRGNTITKFPTSGFVALTRDGKRIAVIDRVLSRTLANTDIWLIDPARGVPRRFTFDPAFEVSPVWSPDGSRLVFGSNRTGVFDLFEKPVSFAHDERRLLATPENKFPNDWTPDGQVLLFVKEDPVTGDDLWTVSIGEPHKVDRLLGGSYAESQGQFSPDGRWLAYRSNESGQWEIYLRPYPGPGSQQLVSRGGGIQPRWRRDGKELFYIAADSRIMSVPIGLPSEGNLDVGSPVALFTARLADSANQQFGYAVAPDGQRFLMNIVADQTSATPITIFQNWTKSLPK